LWIVPYIDAWSNFALHNLADGLLVGTAFEGSKGASWAKH
jgi:hypothetical protein